MRVNTARKKGVRGGGMKAVLIAAIAASVVLHAGLLYALVLVKIERRERLSDSPAPESVLSLGAPVRPALPEPRPEPVSEPPPPQAEPEAPAPEPRPAPPTATLIEPTPESPTPAPKPSAAASPAAPVTRVELPPPVAPPAPVTFAGMEARPASRIVYVVDGSGSMVSTLAFVRAELAASVSRLSPTQKFGVVVFRDEGKAQRFSDGLVAANARNKTRLGAWLAEVQPSGGSDPLEGITVAADLKPELIFLMTRSIRRSAGNTWGEGREATLKALDQLNPANARGERPIVMKVIQFLDKDPTGLLPELANRHGDGPGSYRVITRDELR